MKHTRLARLALALTPLSLSLAALPPPAPAQAPSAPTSNGLPPGTPPLTPDQQQRQTARMARAQQEAAALNANASLSLAQRQQQLLALGHTVDNDMLAILTPTQRAAVLAQRNSFKRALTQFNQQHQAESSQLKQFGQQFAKSVTPQQKRKIDAINKAAGDQVQKLRDDAKMSPQVKQQTAEAIARDATRQALAVLTSAQQAMLTKAQKMQNTLLQEQAVYLKVHGQR